MAGRRRTRAVQKVLHHRFAVAIRMAEVSPERTQWPGIRLPFSSTITAGTPISNPAIAKLGGKDASGWSGRSRRSAHRASQAWCDRIFEFLGECAARQGTAIRIVATVAMAGESNSARLGAPITQVDAGAVERRPEAEFEMQRLTPLVIGLLVTAAAVFAASGKCSQARDKTFAFSTLTLPGSKRPILAIVGTRSSGAAHRRVMLSCEQPLSWCCGLGLQLSQRFLRCAGVCFRGR